MSKKLYYSNLFLINKNKKIFHGNFIILPEFENNTFSIYNGKSFINLKINNEMIGYKFCNFFHTKKKSIFKKNKKK
jgi:ribosomal protein S19